MSSRKLLNLLAGLPPDCWYRISAEQFLEEIKVEQERMHKREVRSLIYAQLTGQFRED